MSNSSIICTCCGHEISVETMPECDYCGYVNVGLVGKATIDKDKTAMYRKKIIKKLKNISISAHQYGWNEQEKKYMQLAQEYLKLADGDQCDGQIFWATQEFGQIFDGDKPVTLNIQYIYDGDKWTAPYPIRPMPCESFWHIGVEVNEHLKLVFYLGDSKQNSKGGEVAFIKN